MYASVVIPIPFVRTHGPLTYRANADTRRGQVVRVPFGRRFFRGVVVALIEDSPIDTAKLRSIMSVDEASSLSAERFALAEWIAFEYMAPLSDVLRLFLPGEVWDKGLPDEATDVASRTDLPADTLLKRSPAQRATYEALTTEPRPLPSTVNRAALSQLVKKGLARVDRVEAPAPELRIIPSPHALNPEQETALEQALAGTGFRASLLFGVTGSGKTEIYLQAMAQTLAAGQSAIFLVPEIALTPQTIGRVEARFPGMVAVVHSGLTDHQRALAWGRVARGHARVVVGPRSALFAPVRDLGLIILDEEHETTYKQETVPRYHARHVAWQLAKARGIPLLLGTATPSVESFAATESGQMRLLRLPTRVSGLMPAIEVVDLREERKSGNYSILSEALRLALGETIAAGRQAVLFLNRRGYSPTLHCLDCGEIRHCGACSVALTLHRRRGAAGSEYVLLCHLCARMEPAPERCLKCGGTELRSIGYGTQRVEQELKKAFPGVRVLRADRDTTKGVGAHDRIYQAVLNREADVLIGTQMIAKGLDLPAVDLVGILLADIGLARPDFRATEYAYALLTQVAGRAGRRGQTGRVILQTLAPEAAAIQAAVTQDTEGFLRAELLLRQAFHYPPYARMAKLSLSRKTAKEAYEELRAFAAQLTNDALAANVFIRGPAPASIAKRKGLYTYHLVLKADRREQFEGLLQNLPPGVQVDIDPAHMD